MKRDTVAPHFLDGGGELGELMRAKDWSATPLGPVDSWPQSLRSAVSILLPSKAQIALFWGPELITLYNDAYRPVFGQKHPRALGQPIRESWSELWRDGLKELFERVLETGEAYWARDRPFFMERHGYLEETFFDVSYDPVRDESGAVGGVFCIVSETTGRVVGERRLKVLRDMAAASADAGGVAEVCERSMRVLDQNPADVPFALAYLFEEKGWRLAASSGVSADDRPGEWPLAAKLELHDLPARFARVPAGPWPERPSSAMVLPLAEGGEEHPRGALVLGISARIAFDDAYRGFFDLVGGQLSASIAAARASEAQRRRAEALAEIDRAKTAFFSNVSHEFRTPLTLMLGPVEDALADAAAPLPAPQRERLELARRNALRLQKLVNTLLEFSRIEAGRVQASYEPVELGLLTAELASSFRSAMEKAGLSLSVDCPPLGEPVYVDREMWEKVILNLLSNAFKFTFEGGVSVSLRRGAAGAELAVRDTGTGIAAHELPHVFKRFRRVEGARSRTHEGTGIGLALVQELVRLHGGAVRAESVAGQGSTFIVTLPFGTAHLPPDRIGAGRALASTAVGEEAFVEEALGWLPDAPASRAEPTRGRARIVWADDNADMREYVRRLLGTRYEVEAVTDGEAALAAARARRPDLVLADVMMPRLDGLGLVRALRADERTRSMPIILLSARAGEEARIEGLDAGADDYLFKPFSARELLAQVAARLDLSRLQQRLQQERADLDNLFRQTPVPTAMLRGAELVFELANPAYIEVVGGREVVGKPLLEAIPEMRGQGFDELLREVIRTGQPHVGHETRLRLERDGRFEDRYFTFIYAPLRGAGGEVDGAIAIVNDVTEQVTAREKIRASEERWRRLVALLPVGVYTCAAPSGAITFHNPHAAELWGRSPQPGDTEERFCGSYRLWTMNGEPLARERTPMALAVAEGREFRNQEVVVERPDGSRITVLVNIDPIRDDQGKVVGAINVFHDTTVLKQAELALKEADRRKDEFIATLSHELRNPLAPLRHALDVLRLPGARAEVAAQALEIMGRQVKHLTRLVDDLLEMSRITRGAFELRRERLAISAVVAHAVETSEPAIRAGRHRLDVSLPGEPLWVEGDALRLAQILANLLDNAAKYTPPGGEIALTARCAGETVDVSVVDNGEGISAEALPRVFEMFSRGDRGSGRGQGGLGIGLALASRLAQMHGGTLEARSAGIGAGAEFVLRLPVAQAAASRVPAEAPEGTRLPPRRVLVVDDNRDAAESLGAVLQTLGAQVQIAHTGPQALEAAQAYRPSVVLLDIGMPGMDGYEVARRLRARQDGAPLTIVALTGWGQDEDRRRTLEAGFDHHLVKPAEMNQLHLLLASLQ